MIRSIKNCKLKITKKSIISSVLLSYGRLKLSEIDYALKVVIKMPQQNEFSDNILKLSKNEFVSRKCKLKSLCPILDSDKKVRVGGRLNNSDWE